MSYQISFARAQENFSQLCKDVVSKEDYVTIFRDEDEPVVLLSLSELNGILETLHLLKSPKNAQRLLTAIQRTEFR